MSKTASLAVVGAGASIAALASQPALRSFIAKWSGYNAPGGVWRIIAILLALGNLKSLPFVWHLRFFRAFLYQLYLQPTPIPPQALFDPIITTSRTSILETDYNIHKSNSTYFADFDISRTHLFTAIIRNGIKKNSRLYGKGKKAETLGREEGPRGKHYIALGGVSCLFKKEIPPLAKYEMWTRLLCWDRKWFYLVTHVVKPGVGKPSKFSLQPWRKGEAAIEGEDDEKVRQKLQGAIYATSLAKYVIKRGRITVPPEQALIDAEMVPAKPEGWVYQGLVDGDAVANGDAESVLPKKPESDEWNWDIIEAERLRGLKFAENFAGLDGLHEVFDGGKDGALGEYPDLAF
ncbi:hypothetical protein BU24DRAFT_422817 [Aaosphaeria arxii CBS 175.79]|uniref:Capsule polysaccharide biosynthesis protein n=1 Tax=Aaosphaeria arxii CBS 175.79 TaxID=1450172 RepID=A0A6A5XU45_9PLEO|nr:uncharacterized protein BU24DRAFT_422817 [Aaosphaeria arxii CBS 175.79]KAF2016473.1 hypothetical protein BU24DRAFT_422817 [Aaosphaeria arxii CBS 175.79]